MGIHRIVPRSIPHVSNKMLWVFRRVAGLVCLLLLLTSPAAAGQNQLGHAPNQPSGTHSFSEEDVSYSNGDFLIHGTVFVPTGAGSELPALVLVAGSGEGVPRDAYRAHAEAFARAGIVTLIYDKRSADRGYSMFDASLDDLADDAIAGTQLLQDRPEVDPDRVGLHGHSEGTWTVALAANRSDDIAFIITSAGSTWSPERTQVWMNKVHLHHAGVTTSLLTPLGETLTRHIVDAEMFRLAGYDPMRALEQLEQPILGLFPEHDRSSPPGESIKHYAQALERGGHQHYELRVVPAADHEMRSSHDGFQLSPEQHNGFTAEYIELVTSWVHSLPDGAGERSADPAPEQPLNSSELAPIAAYESWVIQAVALALMLLTFGAYPVGALITRLRIGRTKPVTRWPARITVTLGLLIPLTTLGYLGYLMFTAAQSLGPIVLGRPIPWLLLQLGALATLCCGAAIFVQWWRHRTTIARGLTVRIALVAIGIIIFGLWAAYWGLLTI